VGAGAQAAFWDPEYPAAHPPVERVVPKAERVSREDLIAIPNSCFDSPSAVDGHIMLAPSRLRAPREMACSQRNATRRRMVPNAAGIFNGRPIV
jgi:hypothetical protein